MISYRYRYGSTTLSIVLEFGRAILRIPRFIDGSEAGSKNSSAQNSPKFRNIIHYLLLRKFFGLIKTTSDCFVRHFEPNRLGTTGFHPATNPQNCGTMPYNIIDTGDLSISILWYYVIGLSLSIHAPGDCIRHR